MIELNDTSSLTSSLTFSLILIILLTINIIIYISEKTKNKFEKVLILANIKFTKDNGKSTKHEIIFECKVLEKYEDFCKVKPINVTGSTTKNLNKALEVFPYWIPTKDIKFLK